MSKNLIIVESPAKAKTINKILGKDYIVKASMGHVRDLPVKSIGVDIENNFQPKYVQVKGRDKVVKELVAAAVECDAVYLAPDPDREGEAIAWHLAELLKSKKVPAEKIFRVAYNEITPRAIRAAFESPSTLDQHRVDAQQARRILDRIVGYMVSPLLWTKIKSGLSAGRVQSVALRLVCERETEIRNFVPEEYWILGAKVRKRKEPVTPFEIRLVRIGEDKADVKSEEAAKGVLAEVEGRELKVKEIKVREISRKAPAPYITSTLQQAGSRFHSYSPQRTMRIAQSLYEGVDMGDGAVGLITYMRTDSVNVAAEAVEACRAMVGEKFGPEYVPEKPNAFRSRASAQEAHEAIRPTDVLRTPADLKKQIGPDEWKLYKIIWERFVASQMAPARIQQRSVDIDALAASSPAAQSFLFRVTSSFVVFPGYMKVSGIEKQKDSEDAEDELPPLEEGEPLDCLEWLSERKETQPPGRYSEASLVRALEENGVGRPSTYAQTIGTLNAREYVTREKRTLTPTDLGMQVNEMLVSNLDQLFNVSFTATMEETLDDVERGSVEWTVMLRDFYEKFAKWLEEAKGPPIDPERALKMIAVLDDVKEWAPEVKRGKRTYGDERFVKSIEKQIKDGKKALSERQLVTLARLANRYREQVPDIQATIQEVGLSDAIAGEESEPPREATLRKIALLKEQSLESPEPDESADQKPFSEREFVESLHARTVGGRRLTANQLRVLDRIVMKYAKSIPNFDAIKEELAIEQKDMVEGDVLRELIEAMSLVKEWKEPVKRGKREFDDRSFYESLASQLDSKGVLSERQYAALKRLVSRYHEQVSNYKELAERHEIRKGKKKQ